MSLKSVIILTLLAISFVLVVSLLVKEKTDTINLIPQLDAKNIIVERFALTGTVDQALRFYDIQAGTLCYAISGYGLDCIQGVTIEGTR